MEARITPIAVRAVRAENGEPVHLIFQDAGSEIRVCFDSSNVHVVRYLRGEVTSLQAMLGASDTDPRRRP